MDGPRNTYFGHCRPYSFPAPWDAVTPDQRALLGPEDPVAALRTLTANHRADTLISSSLVVPGPDHSLALHPFLANSSPVLLALDDCRTPGLANILTTDGCISGERWPFVAVTRDRRIIELLQRSDLQLLLTSDLETAILLQSIGVPAAPIGPMATLGRQDLATLHRIFGTNCDLSLRECVASFDRDAAVPAEGPAIQSSAALDDIPAGSADWNHLDIEETAEPVFVLWSPFSMSRETPPSLGAALDRLRDLAIFQRLDLSSFGRWTPSPAGLEGIRFALSERDDIWIRGAMLDSLHEDKRELEQPRPLDAATAQSIDLASAADVLHRALQTPATDYSSRRKRADAEATYRRVAVEELVNPVLREAALEVDPYRRMQANILGEFSRVYIAKLPGVMATEAVDRTGGGVLDAEKIKASKDFLALCEKMAAIAKELSRCTPTRKFPKKNPHSTTINSIPYARLGSDEKS